MGLASALSTALTGLTAAETTIDVVGNNLANSNTVGFKSSQAAFASQFLQTMSLGSSPTADSGGTNPRQTGLGTMVAEITPNFNQGTIEVSSNPLDMAIQGDGFYIVQGKGGETLYTRNGIFKLNSQNELTTITGNRVMGYGINDDFEVQRTQIVPLEIRLGGAEVAQATQNVYLEGTLTSAGTVADTAEIIQSAILGDSRFSRPDVTGTSAIVATPPDTALTVTTGATTGGAMAVGSYWYKVVFSNADSGDPPAFLASESMASAAFAGTVGAGEDTINLTVVPIDAASNYHSRIIYRTVVGAVATDPYLYAGTIDNNVATVFSDTTIDGGLGAAMNTDSIIGNYRYYVTFENVSGESRPSPAIDAPLLSSNGRIQLLDLPVQGAGDGWTSRNIYRNTAANPQTFYKVATISDATTVSVNYTDNMPDTIAATKDVLDFNGPQISNSTPLINIIKLDDNKNYENMFEAGTLAFTGKKGGRNLSAKEFTIDALSTTSQLIQFMEEAMGIQVPPGPDADHVIPNDGPTSNPPGGSINSNGRIVFVGNNGVDNAIDIFIGSLQLTTATETQSRNLAFSSAQTAVGSSAVTDFLAYDSLGMSVDIRLTAVMESQSNSETVYRWFADSPDNQPVAGSNIAVGTGLIYFDGTGNYSRSTSTSMSIYRRDVPSESPLEVTLNFSELSGLGGSTESNLAVSRQDGSAPGTLTSFIVGEDGTIRGVFSNGITRDLGQLRLARFTNPAGLEQRGQNLFAAGVNSGLAIQGDPNSQGIGSIVTGATELSNTDIGSNLIDLILASTMYRGNTRVITTSQEMLEELLSLRR